MARFKGILQFTGTLGGITGVYSKEGLHARTKKDIPKSRFKTGKEYETLRMNAKYMEGSSQMSKAFRHLFTVFGEAACDTRMYSRMNGAMRRILMCDPVSRKGEFSIVIGIGTPEGKQQLLDFEFNKFVSFNNIFKGVYNLDATSGTITLPRFAPAETLKLAPGSTHAVLESGILAFNFETKEGIFTQSEPLFLANAEPARDIVLSCEVPGMEGATLCYFLKVSFMQEIGSGFYPLKGNDGGVMKIVGVV
jgi:hypothetical protein